METPMNSHTIALSMSCKPFIWQRSSRSVRITAEWGEAEGLDEALALGAAGVWRWHLELAWE